MQVHKKYGPAGTTLYIFNKDILGKSSVPIPTMLDLKTHSDKIQCLILTRFCCLCFYVNFKMASK